ncbi:type II toxin-antitoxin system antitoxin, RelB/DinJ family [Candidatus Peregrinibacteria bacterium CG22_combo_CG10-13_8_21_14_all_44_10]|nr:MAG: hypothetical protein AUK45_01130 [Candidatus Peregrinibacteria bacterium CG2_30_44_17]PIP65935.1 MAG: type II toxin-antitoxin system antitoxin, RelB/DinJ family [Candidatus Peregrinibacteria bacterium CG22_combo_CG10-13_8_21_14_all_44_10]PIS04151.1 MAG: type II toxin-antitoxin system antitoxin, RelB/DinJ family [Candidatus Peregrinibacteria bacterium CG10_big_fil_rev_8_21_14_0_10_44_7]PIX78970.1 MAG: type II toxin-antitoxin system antitoxin, RelB/DinJ family [Candidatus Peregrinibacteria
MATKTAMIRARMKPELKNKAETILESLGLKPTEAITMFYTQIVLKKGVPFSLDLETEDTSGNYTSVSSDDDLKSLLGLN